MWRRQANHMLYVNFFLLPHWRGITQCPLQWNLHLQLKYFFIYPADIVGNYWFLPSLILCWHFNFQAYCTFIEKFIAITSIRLRLNMSVGTHADDTFRSCCYLFIWICYSNLLKVWCHNRCRFCISFRFCCASHYPLLIAYLYHEQKHRKYFRFILFRVFVCFHSYIWK